MGKPRSLNAIGALGLVLMWYRTRGSCARGLAMLFGQTSTPMYKWLKFSCKVLLQVLSRDINSKVALPTHEKNVSTNQLLGLSIHCVRMSGLLLMGLNFFWKKSTSKQKQNYYFNGWKHGHYINCIFVFCPDGKIALCLLNAPGTFHDSTMADYGMYDGLQKVLLLLLQRPCSSLVSLPPEILDCPKIYEHN